MDQRGLLGGAHPHEATQFRRRPLLGSWVNKDWEEGEVPLLARQLPRGNGEGEVTPLPMDRGCAKKKPRPVTYGDRLRVSRSSSRACLRSSRSSRLTCVGSSCSSCLTSSRSSCSSCRSWSRPFSQSCSPSSFHSLPTLTFSLVDSLPLRIVMATPTGFRRRPLLDSSGCVHRGNQGDYYRSGGTTTGRRAGAQRHLRLARGILGEDRPQVPVGSRQQ